MEHLPNMSFLSLHLPPISTGARKRKAIAPTSSEEDGSNSDTDTPTVKVVTKKDGKKPKTAGASSGKQKDPKVPTPGRKNKSAPQDSSSAPPAKKSKGTPTTDKVFNKALDTIVKALRDKPNSDQKVYKDDNATHWKPADLPPDHEPCCNGASNE